MMRRTITGILLIILSLGWAAEPDASWESIVIHQVTESFSRSHSLPPDAVRVQVKSLPDFRPFSPETVDARIYAEDKTGYQTVWVEIYENGIYRKKYPATLKLSVVTPVVIAAGKISRNKILTERDLAYKTVEIDRNLESVFLSTETLIGQQARHVIQPGTVLKSSMVSRPYAIIRGEQVSLKIVVGNLVVESVGIAQSSGQKGDPVRVRSLATGKTIHGLAGDNKEVLVQMKGDKYATMR